MLNISLADYKVGNLHSLKKSLENCGAKVTVVTSMDELLDAECIAFPGVGAFDKTMEALLPYREEICKKLSAFVDLTAVDALTLAREAGNIKAVNVVLIGVMAKNTEIAYEDWVETIKATVPPKFLEANLKAFDLGYHL